MASLLHQEKEVEVQVVEGVVVMGIINILGIAPSNHRTERVLRHPIIDCDSLS